MSRTTPRYDRTVAGIADNLIDSLRTARRNTTESEGDSTASHVFKAIARHDPRQYACHHIAAILVDAVERGAPEEDVQSFARELEAEIHFLYAKRDGMPKLPEAHQAEEHAEGIAEEAELAFCYSPDNRTFSELVTAKARHMIESQRLLDVARAQISRGMQS